MRIKREPPPVLRPIVERWVMPIKLEPGMKLGGIITLSMLREDLAKQHYGKTLKQIADSGGVSPSEAVAIKDHRWKPVANKIGLEILTRCLPANPPNITPSISIRGCF